MLNPLVGAIERYDDVDWIRTAPGAIGHASYGPYVALEPGRYIVAFTLRLPEAVTGPEDPLCCFIDVVTNQGNDTLAFQPVLASQIGTDGKVTLGFELGQTAEVEYRVHANGSVPLLIADNAVAHPSHADAWTAPWPRTQFMLEHKPMMKRLHDMGVAIAVVGDRLVMEKAGVRFNARIYDDTNFVHELFVVNAYNLIFGKPTCIIDIGMNVALASLLFATKPFVEEIYAFEPFDATYDRGLANIALNPELAPKIRLNKFGLGDNVDGEIVLNIYDSGDSGAMSTRDIEGGTPMRVSMRDTADTLRPIIADVCARGLEVVVKVDCEGSEFAVFASLARNDLLKEIRGFMVEWHRVFAGRTQDELVAPLIASGFMVFDITPPDGNGFFYAVRTD